MFYNLVNSLKFYIIVMKFAQIQDGAPELSGDKVSLRFEVDGTGNHDGKLFLKKAPSFEAREAHRY